MRRTNAEHQRAYRDRVRGGPPRAPVGCPSASAYRRHQRNPDDVCVDPEGCLREYREYNRLAQQRRRERMQGD